MSFAIGFVLSFRTVRHFEKSIQYSHYQCAVTYVNLSFNGFESLRSFKNGCVLLV